METTKSPAHATAWLDHADLLHPDPLLLEMGVSFSDQGILTVQVRNDLHGCNGAMLDWWFTFFETTEHIRWWHPVDHVRHDGWDSAWVKGKNYYGATIRAVEKLSDLPATSARLKFHDPATVFPKNAWMHASEAGHASAAVCARIGFGEAPVVDAEGDPVDGQMLHVARDTSFGCVLRSRFVLGLAGAPLAPDEARVLGLNLMKHCYNEFSCLSRLLPSLYDAEVLKQEARLPW